MHPALDEERLMKTIVTLVLCSILALGSHEAGAKKPQCKRVTTNRPHKSRVLRTKTRARRRTVPTLAEQSDEIVLSPNLLRKLQSNLVDGGYLTGTIDGRLTPRTRRALAEFQREYHMPGTGALDRATAEALLGHELISTFLVAQSAD
jgi:peptidoglycan hydrolase-like protein with peptidoglycan-binding domain